MNFWKVWHLTVLHFAAIFIIITLKKIWKIEETWKWKYMKVENLPHKSLITIHKIDQTNLFIIWRRKWGFLFYENIIRDETNIFWEKNKEMMRYNKQNTILNPHSKAWRLKEKSCPLSAMNFKCINIKLLCALFRWIKC